MPSAQKNNSATKRQQCAFLRKSVTSSTRLLFLFLLLILILASPPTRAMQTHFYSSGIENGSRKTMLLRNFLRVNHLRRRIKREHAFDLLKLESQLGEISGETDANTRSAAKSFGGSIRRDDALNDEKCQQSCNEKLRGGLDMIKAHSAFGSVGVPSVVDELDLRMFCRFDSAHDLCLRDCGFEIHYNMRDYVCQSRYEEMVSNLACYDRASTLLKRKCGAQRCGPYTELEVSLFGFAQRCRSLLCDLNCIQGVLQSQCGRESGERAAKFLIDYSKVQISNWMRDMSKSVSKPIAQIIPPSCARLFCERFDAQNCTSIIKAQSVAAADSAKETGVDDVAQKSVAVPPQFLTVVAAAARRSPAPSTDTVAIPRPSFRPNFSLRTPSLQNTTRLAMRKLDAPS